MHRFRLPTRAFLILVLVALGGPICMPQAPPEEGAAGHAAGPVPPDAGFAFVTGTARYEAPVVPRPSKGAALRDPTFHTTLARMTDQSADGYVGPGIQNEYSKMDPENADGTRVILRSNSAAYYLYDASRFTRLEQLTVFNACCCQEPEPRWDASDPDLFYFVCGAELRRYRLDTHASELVHDFRVEFPRAASIRTKMEGDPSLDRRYWAFMVEDDDWKLLAVIVYDRERDTIVGRQSGGFPDAINWVGMSMAGGYCIVGYEDAANFTEVFARDLRRSTKLPEGSAGHGDAALLADGREVYVYQNVRTDYIAMADMQTGAETNLVPIPFDVNPDIGLHISGNCGATPDWVLVSTYGAMNPPAGRLHSWMDTQLFMLELRANPRIWRIAHTHAYTQRRADGEGKNYFAEAFAAINRAGSRIYFGSNWGDLTPDYSETYQVVLPAAWADRVPR